MSIELIMRQAAHLSQLLFLPGLIQNFLTCLYLVVGHLRADFHPFLIQLHDLLIDTVQFTAQLQ